jgi:uncharacterized cupin superfamily protein
MVDTLGLFLSPGDLATRPVDPVGPRNPAYDGEPFESIHTIFDDGRTTVGIWECTPGRFPVAKDGTHSCMYILAGDATVTDAGGREHLLRPGCVLMEPDGWAGEWHIRETIRKFYVITRTTETAAS